MEFWKMTLMVVWTFVGIMFLGSGIASIWCLFKSFSWMDYLKEIDTKNEE